MPTDSPQQTAPDIGVLLGSYYALPIVPVYMMLIPMYIIQGIYAKYYGIALTSLAAIGLVSRLLDAVSDPLVGYWSDRYYVKYGSRKPFIVIGGLGVLVCAYFIYLPPDQVSVLYCAIWFIAIYTAFTVFEIPHVSWPCDLSPDSSNRTRLFSYRVFANYCGLIVFYGIPLLPFFVSSEMTPDTLAFSFYVAALLMVPCLIQALRRVPNGNHRPEMEPLPKAQAAMGIKQTLHIIVSNTPFLLFLLAFVCSMFGAYMWIGLIFIYVDVHLGMGEQFAKMFFVAFIAALLMTPLWHRIIVRFGNKKAWMVGALLSIGSLILTGMLEVGNTSFAQLITLKIMQTCGLVCMGIVVPSMLSDIVDYSRWKSGSDTHTASYFSIKVFFDKVILAAGPALALAITGWGGFDATAAVNSETAIASLKLAIVWIPLAVSCCSLLFVALSPINQRRHRIITQRLESLRLRRERSLAGASHRALKPSNPPNPFQETHYENP